MRDLEKTFHQPGMLKIKKMGKVRSAEGLLRTYIPERFSHWPDNYRGIANEIARSALIHYGHGGKGLKGSKLARKYLNNVTLFTLGKDIVTYTGEELRDKDDEILTTLIHYARNLPSGKLIVTITSSEICKINNWRQDQRYYDQIFFSIQRMRASVLTVFSRRLAKVFRCQQAIDAGASEEELVRLYDDLEAFDWEYQRSQIKGHAHLPIGGIIVSLIAAEPIFTGARAIENGIPKGNLTWRIQLDQKLAHLYSRPYLTLVDIQARQALAPIGKRLQSYFLSHAKPHPILLRSLEKMLNIHFDDIGALKYCLTTHLQDLKDNKVIVDFDFSRSASGTDWTVLVTRKQLLAI